MCFAGCRQMGKDLGCASLFTNVSVGDMASNPHFCCSEAEKLPLCFYSAFSPVFSLSGQNPWLSGLRAVVPAVISPHRDLLHLSRILCPPMPGPLSNVPWLELGTNSVISDFHSMHCCVCAQPLLVTSSAGGMKAQTEPGTAPNLALHLLNSCGTGAGSEGEDAPGQEGHRARTVLSEHPSSSSARNSMLQVLSSCCAGSRDCWNVKHSAPSHPHRNPATAASVCSARCL